MLKISVQPRALILFFAVSTVCTCANAGKVIELFCEPATPLSLSFSQRLRYLFQPELPRSSVERVLIAKGLRTGGTKSMAARGMPALKVAFSLERREFVSVSTDTSGHIPLEVFTSGTLTLGACKGSRLQERTTMIVD